jgi:hypothetical protein
MLTFKGQGGAKIRKERILKMIDWVERKQPIKEDDLINTFMDTYGLTRRKVREYIEFLTSRGILVYGKDAKAGFLAKDGKKLEELKKP